MHNKNAVQRRSYADFCRISPSAELAISLCGALCSSSQRACRTSWKARRQGIAFLQRYDACIAHLGSDGPFKLLPQGVLTWECSKKFGVFRCWFGHCLPGTSRKTFGTARTQIKFYENCLVIHSDNFSTFWPLGPCQCQHSHSVAICHLANGFSWRAHLLT